MLDLFEQINQWRRWSTSAINVLEFQYWNDGHISTVGGYISDLSTTCDFPELPCAKLLPTNIWWKWEPQIVVSFIQQLKEIFLVPRLTKFHQTQNRINKPQLIQAFLSFLLQLLYHKAADLTSDRIGNLEKELRSLLTILGDISWMLCDSHKYDAEYQNLLGEFEAAANQAGGFVYYLFFYPDPAFGEMDAGLDAFLYQADLLKANILSFISASAYVTPRTCVVDSFLILHSLVDNLEDLLNQEDDPIADVKGQLKFLHHELLLSHSSIHEMRSPQPSEIGEVKEALMCIGGIAHQAQYLITTFLVKDIPVWYVINRLTDLNHRIEILRKELQLITKKYKFGGFKVAEYSTPELPLHDKRNTEDNDVFVGFENKTMEILDQLVGGTQSLQIISILGMPGLETKFSRDEVLKMEEETLIERIYKTLKGRRYLIVLDDVWDSNILDALLRYFPDDGNGSRILLTSRSKDVAPPNSIMHKLPFLTDEQCWELLEKKVFGSGTCPPELQGIGKKIAAKCCRLPLTVVIIAGVLSSLDEEEGTWERVRGSLASYIDGEDNSVMQILELSYKHLPDHLKPCFLYFGEFDEDEEISVGKLKRLWVAEGFIRKEKDKSAENVAEEYLMELIDKSMVMIGKRRTDGRGAKSCVVHDLLHDFCLKKSKEESFLIYLNNDFHTFYEKGHLLRVFGKTSTLSYCQHVRSFAGNCVSNPLYVRELRLLRVLHFNSIYNFGSTFGTEYLVNLRFLVIEDLPTWIHRFVNLEYLRLHTLETIYLPPTIVKMNKLRYFHAQSAEYSEDWNDSYQTNKLEYLSGVTIKTVKDEELLKCSPHLRELKCRYYLDEKWGCPTPHYDLRFLTQLHSLSLERLLRKNFGFPSNIRRLTLRMSGLPWEQMSIVGRLEFLEVLKLRKYAFEGERWNTRDGEFQKLKFLQLENIHLSEWNVASNDHFPKLQQLILINCRCLQEIPCEISEITALELIKVDGECLSTLVESAERIEEEQQDMGNEELKVIIGDVHVTGNQEIQYYSGLEDSAFVL
ncbi:hypothetical protein ACS0TY_021092 [Phlomoides rotata]